VWICCGCILGFRFSFIGVLTGLQAVIPVYFNKSRAYFRWDKKIPSFDLDTSIPRKYFKWPRDFISNSWARRFCNAFCSPGLFLVTIISSTYTINLNTKCKPNICLFFWYLSNQLPKPFSFFLFQWLRIFAGCLRSRTRTGKFPGFSYESFSYTEPVWLCGCGCVLFKTQFAAVWLRKKLIYCSLGPTEFLR